MWFSILLCGILCTVYPVSGDKKWDRQCIDNCTCCIDEDCGKKLGFINACLKGCIDGHRGLRCYELCQYPNCKSCGGGSLSKECTECYDGYFLGPNKNCTSACPSNCKSCSSSTNCIECNEGFHNENDSKTCKYAHCKSDNYGQHCEQKCSRQCQNETCSKYTGMCFYGCKNGFSGDKCCVESDNCLNCYSNTECKTCKSGFFQHSCKQRCPTYCLGPCEMATGVCSGCLYNRFGVFCSFACSQNCKTVEGNISRCAQSDGTCISGCEDGFYGLTCNKTCNSLCKRNVCKQDTGICSFGCYLNKDEPECVSTLETSDAFDVEKMTIAAVIGSLFGIVLMILVLLTIIIIVLRRRSSRRLSRRHEFDVTYENQGASPDVHSTCTRPIESSRANTTSASKTVVYEDLTEASGEVHDYQKIPTLKTT